MTDEPIPAEPVARQPSLEEQLDRAATALLQARSPALACHINPDPDAAGSMLGLGHHLASLGKAVVCSWGNQPMHRPSWLALLDGDAFLVDPPGFPKSPEVMVTLDTASPERLGALTPNADRAKELIVIDHHRTNAGFGSILVLDPLASSTAEIVFRLIERLGGDLSDRAAACLYAGVITDTGRFQYEATTPATLRVAASLRTHPFDHTRMAQLLFEDSPLSALRLLGMALSRIVHVPEADLIWTYVTQSDLKAAAVGAGGTDDLIEVVRRAREADVACLLRQQTDGRFKVSLRSKGRTDVGALAQAFGGGGHRLAAGFTATGGLEDAVRRIVAGLESAAATPG